jgi:hypothetical protein
MKTISSILPVLKIHSRAVKSFCCLPGDCELVSIASLAGTTGETIPGADRGVLSVRYMILACPQSRQNLWSA